jgi:transposase InsO family protein
MTVRRCLRVSRDGWRVRSSWRSWLLASMPNAGPVVVGGLLGRPSSTVWKVLRRYGCSRLSRAPVEPPNRYERARPGELVHVDIKRLGRFHTPGKRVFGDRLARNRHAGWQYVHLAIDDHSRLAYAEILPTESPDDCARFLRRAVGWYRDHHITVQRVISDKATAIAATPGTTPAPSSASNAATPDRAGHRPTAKAEALVKTLLREWAYRFTYPTSSHRAQALPGYLRWYNTHRPHGSLGGHPPISRVSHVRGQHT